MTSHANHRLPERLYGLDHLRGLAIAGVFLFHYQLLSAGQPKWLPRLVKFGWTGVDLFFVLSGFLIASQLFSQIAQKGRFSWKEFFFKRFFRIVPLFVIVVGIYFCFPLFREKEALPPLWKFLTFTQNLDMNVKAFGTFSQAWSLCVEEHFYLLFPLTLLLLQAFRRFNHSYWLLLALFLGGFASRLYSFHHLYLPVSKDANAWMYWSKYLYYPTYNRLDGLLAGVAVASVYQFLPKTWLKIARYGNEWLLLSVVVLTVGVYYLRLGTHGYVASIFGFSWVALGYGLMVMGAVCPTSFLYQWHSKTTTFVATLSYAIYLTHKGVIHMTHQLFAPFHWGSTRMLIICIITCTIAAWLLHLIVEIPFLAWRNRILKTVPSLGSKTGSENRPKHD